MKNISFITTCKGRLHHLKETLPTLLAEKPAEVIVVDYGCPQNTANWVRKNYPEVKVVQVSDDPGFCLPRARNRGAQVASSDWLVFIDADIKVSSGWLGWMNAYLTSHNFYRASRVGSQRDPETYGTVIVERESFDTLGGYDEAFRGWGGEDVDLYKRLFFSGYKSSEYPNTFVRALRHDDSERLKFHDIKQKDIHHIVNQCYMQAKFQIMSFYGLRNNPKIEIREKVMAKVKHVIGDWHKRGGSDFPVVSFKVSNADWLPEPYNMEKVLTFSMKVALRKDHEAEAE